MKRIFEGMLCGGPARPGLLHGGGFLRLSDED